MRELTGTVGGSARRAERGEAGAAADAPRERVIRPVRGRRRPWLIALGLLVASVGTLLIVWLVGAAGQRQEVLVVRQAVPYGDVLGSEHLGVVRVSVDPGVRVVPASQRSTVVGLVAVTHLTPGSLLSADAVAPAAEPRAGRVLVPLPLGAERMPAGGLRAGDRILTVPTQAPSEGGGDWSVPATVVRVGPVDVNGVVVVDVTTAVQDGTRLTVAAAQGAVAIVVQPIGG